MKSLVVKKIVSATSAGLLLGALMVGSASADTVLTDAVPTVGVGSVSCRIVGQMKFSTPLVNGGIEASTTTVKAAAVRCSGTGDGATVASGRVTSVMLQATNDCLAPPSTIDATIVWKTRAGAPALADSTIALNVRSRSVGTNGKPILDDAGTVTSGSFTGGAITTTLALTASSTNVGRACENGTLKRLTFSAAQSRLVISEVVTP